MGVMKFFIKKIEKKKRGRKKQIHCDEEKKKNTWGEFCRFEKF